MLINISCQENRYRQLTVQQMASRFNTKFGLFWEFWILVSDQSFFVINNDLRDPVKESQAYLNPSIMIVIIGTGYIILCQKTQLKVNSMSSIDHGMEYMYVYWSYWIHNDERLLILARWIVVRSIVFKYYYCSWCEH